MRIAMLFVAVPFSLACGSSTNAASTAASAAASTVQPPRIDAKNCRPSPFADSPRTADGSQSRLEVKGSQNSDLPGVDMTITEESGSLVSATTVVLHARSDEPDARVDFETRLDRMVTVHRIPNDMLGKDQRERRRAVADAAFTLTCARPEPSLERLLERGRALRWYDGRPELPTNYVLHAEETDGGATEWVEYLGANHSRRTQDSPADDLHLLHAKGELELRGSAHGAVIVNSRTRRFAWIYVYPGGSKLRFPSVRAGTLTEGRAVLRLNQPEFDHDETLVEVDLVTGAVALIP